jgi:hypothetical protein
VEIQKFAEGDDEEDYSGLFDGFVGPNERSGDSEDGFEGDSLLLNTRLSNEYWVGEVGSDEEDPFAEIDEGFDEMGTPLFLARLTFQIWRPTSLATNTPASPLKSPNSSNPSVRIKKSPP